MKESLFWKYFGFIILGIVVFGFVSPYLISSKSYELPILGFIISIGYIYIFVKFIINHIKN